MSKTKIFLTLTGYQLTWIACVFGEKNFDQPLFGIYLGTLYFVLYFYFNKNKFKFLKISLSISIPGYFFDSLMVYYSIYEFNVSLIIGVLPAWMLILWLSFSTLFDEILTIFKKYKIIGVILSSFLAPLTYYVGEPIGIISISNIWLFFSIMIIFWVLLMIYYLFFVLKED